MRQFLYGSIALAVSACATAPAPYVAAPSPRSLVQGDLGARTLAAHNVERAAIRLPLLVWDPSLASGASSYAQYLASTGTFAHSDRRARPGIGENLWMGTRGGFSPEQMVGNWASEKRWFRPGIFPRVSSTGRWSDVGHYTQLIWPTTSRVGCGLASGRGRDVLVCRYAPAGNIDGRRVP